jgi:hypothetical protein
VPVLGERLARGAVILLDDAERTGESEVLTRWCREFQWRARLQASASGAFALATR